MYKGQGSCAYDVIRRVCVTCLRGNVLFYVSRRHSSRHWPLIVIVSVCHCSVTVLYIHTPGTDRSGTGHRAGMRDASCDRRTCTIISTRGGAWARVAVLAAATRILLYSVLHTVLEVLYIILHTV